MTPEPPRDIELAPVLPRDLELVRGWLRRPHVARWWGDPDPSQAIVSNHPPSAQALITVDGGPVGYVLWQKLSREERAAAGLGALPSDHIDVDILIGEPELLGRGIGPPALRLVLDRLRSEGVPSAGLGTAMANQRARRAFAKAGFRLFRKFEEDGRAMCYMIRDLVAAE